MDDAVVNVRDHEDLSKLFGGVTFSAQRKNHNAFNVIPMMTIMCSNKNDVVPMDEERWAIRIQQLNVRTLSPELQDRFSVAPINPKGWVYVLNEIN